MKTWPILILVAVLMFPPSLSTAEEPSTPETKEDASPTELTTTDPTQPLSSVSSLESITLGQFMYSF